MGRTAFCKHLVFFDTWISEEENGRKQKERKKNGNKNDANDDNATASKWPNQQTVKKLATGCMASMGLRREMTFSHTCGKNTAIWQSSRCQASKGGDETAQPQHNNCLRMTTTAKPQLRMNLFSQRLTLHLRSCADLESCLQWFEIQAVIFNNPTRLSGHYPALSSCSHWWFCDSRDFCDYWERSIFTLMHDFSWWNWWFFRGMKQRKSLKSFLPLPPNPKMRVYTEGSPKQKTGLHEGD